MTKLDSREEALAYIKKNLNFRGREVNSSSIPSNLQNAYFSGEPKIDEEKSVHGVKAWKYRWPEEGEVSHWVTDDGVEHPEVDIDDEMEFLVAARKV